MSEEEDSEDPEKKLAAVIVQNTGRYSPLKLWKGLREFRNTAIQDRSIAYPYWENAARMTSVKMEILFAFSLLAAAVFLVTVISEICLLYAHRKWHLKDFLEDMMYKYTYKKRVSDYISTPSENGEGKYDQ
jgi:hypothetical protein